MGHDYIRGRVGSFREVLDGIGTITEYDRTRVILVATISQLNFDKSKELAEFARELGIGISYNAVEPTVGFASRKEEATAL